jgi:hypothetical protein
VTLLPTILSTPSILGGLISSAVNSFCFLFGLQESKGRGRDFGILDSGFFMNWGTHKVSIGTQV